MNFSSWKHWVGSLSWSRRWFVFLILLRPLADNFYHLKKISPIYSPPYIIGIITPILIFFILFFKRSRHSSFTLTDKLFLIWSFFLFLSCFFLLFNQPTLARLGGVLKILTPTYIYFYLRYFIKSKDALEKILQTGVYAAIIPAVIILYETFFSPIQISYSRGVKRMYGAYADVLSYGIYIILTIVIFGYYLLISKKKIFFSREKFKILLIFSICFLGLIRIAHGATYGVFIAIIAIFLFYNLKLRKIRGVILIFILIVVGYFSIQGIYKERIGPLAEKEIRILEGKGKIESIFHGRGRRWVSRSAIFAELPIMVQLFGPPIGNIEESSVLWGGSVHNDFFRILFLTGIFGLISYLLILISIFIKGFSLPYPERFLVNGALLSVIIYSITAHPMIYNPLLYIILAIFAYTSLPRLGIMKFTFSRAF